MEAMFDHVLAAVEAVRVPLGPWRRRLSALLIHAIETLSGHGGLARVGLTSVPTGPHAQVITERVRGLLAEAGLSEPSIAAGLDLLGLFASAAALDRVALSAPAVVRRRRLRWEVEVIISGLLETPAPAGGRPTAAGR